MANDVFVYSILTDSVVYTLENGKEVLIAGGANVPDQHFYTPQGVVTKVSDADLNLLKNNRVFQLHHKNGFLKWTDKKVEVEAVGADMQGADDAAPDTEADAEVVEKKTGTKVRAKRGE